MTTLRECFEIWRAKALREPSCLQLLKAAVHCLRKEKLLARNVFDHIYYAMQSSRLQQVKAVSHLELHTMSKSLKAILNYVVKLRRFRVSLANVYYKQLLFDHFQALKQFHMICQRRIEDCRHQLRQNRKRNTLHFMAAHAAKRISQKRQSKLGDKDQETVFRMPYELTPSKDPVVQALNLRSASLLEPRNTITLLDSTARRRFTPITTVPSLPVVVMPSRENL